MSRMRTIVVVLALVILGSGAVSGEDAPAGLRVDEFGVGTGVADDRSLVGASDTFPEGAQVVFWTRVEGGADGDTVDHVWIREGEEVVVVGLPVGSSSWRTWSRKTLHPGSAGRWAVEARDADGRVLARAEFTCTAPGTE